MEYQLLAAKQIWFVLPVPVIVGISYYFTCSGAKSLKFAVAAHSLLLLVAFGYALAVSRWSEHGNWQVFIWPFWAFLVSFVGAGIYSVVRFDGNPSVHALQLIQLPSAVLIWFVGTMTITHDWL